LYSSKALFSKTKKGLRMSSFGTTPLRGDNLLVFGGKIYPEAEQDTWVEAMLVTNGVVASLGTIAELREQTDESHTEIDLAGRTVLPGFIDAHTHVEGTAISRNLWLDVRDLSVDETCAKIARAAAELVPGSWVRAQGTFLQPLPTREQLDEAVPHNPVIVRESAHRLQANSLALSVAGLAESAPPVGPGVVIHVDNSGVPTGLVEEALHLFPEPELTDELLRSLIVKELSESFARRGITTIYEIPVSLRGIDAYLQLADEGILPTRITLTPFINMDGIPSLARIEDWDRRKLGDQIDSDLIAPGGAKIILDGDNEQAFDSEFFNRQPRQWGAVTRTLGALREEMAWAIENDVQVLVHAIGDLAQEMMLEAVDQAQKRAGKPTLPMRLEHAANLQLSQTILDRLEELDVIPVPTASFIATDDGTGVYAFRTLIDAGMRPPGNSDTLGSIALAPSPWYGISLMLGRTNSYGSLVAPEEQVTMAEAIRTYTQYAAEAAGLDQVIGSLREGYAADFAIYAQDPRAREVSELSDVEADITAVGGRIVWSRMN
jgi:predicted amidohydrolase YtcJ